VTLYRAFAWREAARPSEPDGPLWFPRVFQGDGRHDNAEVYGCLYLSDLPESCIVEQLAAFRGQRLTAALLRRRGLPLALAQLELDDRAELIDLDDPSVLVREGLRPSHVATRDRATTQPRALELYRAHKKAAGLRWWSTWEALWANATIFERAAKSLKVTDVSPLTLAHPALLAAAEFFGLRVSS
jgi:hypothetical protein